MKTFSIAIDGPAGAGKSSVAKAVAAALGAHTIDTGAMYRAMGLYMLRRGVDVRDAAAVTARADEPVITIGHDGDGRQITYLDGEDVSGVIRSPECSAASSAVSAVPAVRARMVALQRDIARGISLVMDGRDIGTTVLPDATVKIFLTATPEERARRRVGEYEKKGESADYEEILREIIARDYQDSHREVSPLAQAEDAVLLDTSDMNIDQVIESILRIAKEKI